MNENLEYLACVTASCGGQWLPAAKLKQLRESHATFYCPSGHPQWFAGKSEKEKRIEELELEVRALIKDRDIYKRWYEEEKRLKHKARLCQYALKGHISRLKKLRKAS